jgi:hypothetical protein
MSSVSKKKLWLLVIVFTLLAIVLFIWYGMKPENETTLTEYDWITLNSDTCIRFSEGSIFVGSRSWVGPRNTYTIRVNGDSILFLNTNQTQYFYRNTEYRLLSRTKLYWLTIEGNGPIPPGRYLQVSSPSCE